MPHRIKFLKSLLEKVASSKGFDRYMKNVQILSAGDGKCKAQFSVTEEHLNLAGFLHGAFTAAIIDTVTLYAQAIHGCSPGASVDLHVMFLKTAFPGEVVTVNAKTIHAGKNLAYFAVELTKNDGKDIIARGQHTKFLSLPNQVSYND